MAASLPFYTDVLGFTVEVTMGEPASFAILVSGDASLALASTVDPAVAGIASVYLEVDDVDAAHARASAAGCEPTEPVDHPWGLRDFVVRDPDGHLLAIGARTGAG